MTEAQRRSLKKHKANIKERIRLSNDAVMNGLPPDPWVIEFRKKNNEIKGIGILTIKFLVPCLISLSQNNKQSVFTILIYSHCGQRII